MTDNRNTISIGGAPPIRPGRAVRIRRGPMTGREGRITGTLDAAGLVVVRLALNGLGHDLDLPFPPADLAILPLRRPRPVRHPEDPAQETGWAAPAAAEPATNAAHPAPAHR